MPSDRPSIGSCDICKELRGEIRAAYFRRNFVDPRTGARRHAVQMCRGHSNKVSRYGHPYFKASRVILSPGQKAEIARRYAREQVTQAQLAQAYGVRRETIARVIMESRDQKSPDKT